LFNVADWRWWQWKLYFRWQQLRL